MSKLLFVILANENSDDHELWVKACENRNTEIDYKVVNLSRSDWFERIIENRKANCFLCKPPGITSAFKQLYDERLMILAGALNLPLYPTLNECLIYENKRFLSYWLKAHSIPYPETSVFYDKEEALKFIKYVRLPIVAKVNIGASGSGITILHSKEEASNYIHDTFERKGVKRRSGPNLKKSSIFKRGLHYIFHPVDINKKLQLYKTVRQDIQKDFVIFYEYIPHNFEWRVVRIGDSFFAHKKIRTKEKASGSLQKDYENPPLGLLDFVKGITDKHQFYSQAVDIFESKDRGYLVNEMQCIFGQSDSYQMLVDGKPGRYRFLNKQWIFEEGYFNQNQSYNLRLDYIINNLK